MKIKEKLEKSVELAKKVPKFVATYFVDSTALLLTPLPLYSAYETLLVGMRDIVSLNSKLDAVEWTYKGLGIAVSLGRKASRWMWGITKESPERVQKRHDLFYFAAINIPLSVNFYLRAGETDWEKIAWGAGISSLLGAITGPISGYLVDSARDIAHLEECKRPGYVKYIKPLPTWAKTSLAPLAVAASIALTTGVYHLSSDKSISEHYRTNSLEQKVLIDQSE